MDWEYFPFFPPLKTKLVDTGDGTYELIALVCHRVLHS